MAGIAATTERRRACSFDRLRFQRLSWLEALLLARLLTVPEAPELVRFFLLLLNRPP